MNSVTRRSSPTSSGATIPFALANASSSGPKLALRFKPIKQLVLRVDVPLPVFPLGFQGGLAALYGF